MMVSRINDVSPTNDLEKIAMVNKINVCDDIDILYDNLVTQEKSNQNDHRNEMANLYATIEFLKAEAGRLKICMVT